MKDDKFDMVAYQREYARKKREEARESKRLLKALYDIFVSNAGTIAPNLDDDQLKLVKEVDGFVSRLG